MSVHIAFIDGAKKVPFPEGRSTRYLDEPRGIEAANFLLPTPSHEHQRRLGSRRNEGTRRREEEWQYGGL